jgi:hypothetical protein
MTELPAYGFWNAERDDVPHQPPDGMEPLTRQIFTALQVALLSERANSGEYVSFLEPHVVSLDGKFRVDEMARYIAEALNPSAATGLGG